MSKEIFAITNELCLDKTIEHLIKVLINLEGSNQF